MLLLSVLNWSWAQSALLGEEIQSFKLLASLNPIPSNFFFIPVFFIQSISTHENTLMVLLDEFSVVVLYMFLFCYSTLDIWWWLSKAYFSLLSHSFFRYSSKDNSRSTWQMQAFFRYSSKDNSRSTWQMEGSFAQLY